MYTIADEKDKTMHWGAIIDEGYGSYDPHIELNINLRRKHHYLQIAIREDVGEAQAVADMLRTLADDIESRVKSIQARQRAIPPWRARARMARRLHRQPAARDRRRTSFEFSLVKTA